MITKFSLLEKQIEQLCASECHQDVVELGDDLVYQGVDLRNGWEYYGISLLRVGLEREGISALEKATLVRPLRERTRIALAVAYGRTGKKELAKDLLLTLATSHRLDALDLLQLAAGLDAINEPRHAIEACRRAWKIAPEIARVYYDMAYYCLRCRYPKHLVEGLLRRAVEMESDNADFSIGLMSFLKNQGRVEEAFEIVRRCSSNSIGNVKCRCCIERVINLMVDLGRSEDAAAWMNQLSTLDS